jgi:hypothetical protein
MIFHKLFTQVLPLGGIIKPMTTPSPNSARTEPSEHSPASRIANEKWLAEMGALQEKLKQNGIEQTKVGLEIEFSPEHGKEFNNKEKNLKDHCVKLARSELSKGLGAFEKQRRQERAGQMQHFLPYEFLMYELHDVNPRTKDILEYSFGKGQLGSGYYDNPGVFEIRLKPTSPEQLCKNHQTVMEELEKLMKFYGARFKFKPTYHVNISFWKDSKDNVLNTSSDSHITLGKQVVEGMARAAYDGFCLIRDPRCEAFPNSMGVGFSRTKFLRLANGRLEVRLPNDTENYQHPESIITLAMAGALHGLQAHAKQTVDELLPATPVVRAVFKSKNNDAPHVLHLLNSAYAIVGQEQNNQRTVNCDLRYACMTLADLCKEMRLISKDDKDTYVKLCQAGHNYLLYGDDGKKDYEGKALYEQYMPRVIDALTGISWEGNHANPNAQLFKETMKHLNQSIALGGVHASFMVKPLYPLGKLTVGGSVAQLITSEALRTTLSPVFLQELKEHVFQDYGAPTHGEKLLYKARSELLKHIVKKERYGVSQEL